MSEVSIAQLHDDMIALRREVQELKECFHEDFLELSPGIVQKVKEARQRMRKEFVSHNDVRKEFG